jgi:hypothetical protein
MNTQEHLIHDERFVVLQTLSPDFALHFGHAFQKPALKSHPVGGRVLTVLRDLI